MKKFLLLILFLSICSSAYALDQITGSSGASDLYTAMQDILRNYALTTLNSDGVPEPETEIDTLVVIMTSSMTLDRNISLPFYVEDVEVPYTIQDEDGEEIEDSDTFDFYISNLEIHGANSVITMSDSERHFTMTGGNLTLDGVNLNGGNSAGGIEFSSGNLILNGVTFTSCFAENGGALYISSGAEIALDGRITFRSNSAENSGGAIYIDEGGSLILRGGASFSDNSSGSSDEEDGGGAIFNAGSLTLAGSRDITFLNSRSYSFGGGIYMALGSSLNLAFTEGASARFNNSTAQRRGGGIYFAQGVSLPSVSGIDTPTLNEMLSFSNSFALDGDEDSNDGGGAIYYPGSVRISGLQIDGGSDIYNPNAIVGGGVYARGSVTVYSGDLSGSTSDVGGAIYSTGSVAIYGGNFSNNTSTKESPEPDEDDVSNNEYYGGGAIFATGSVNVFRGTFSGNAANPDSGYGGAIFSTGKLTISGDATFGGGSESDGNSASHGGAVFSPSTSPLEINGGTFSNNHTTAISTNQGNANQIYHGGAIYSLVRVILRNSPVFSGNRAISGNGGAIYVEGTLRNENGSPYFASNQSLVGGAVYATDNVEMNNASFDANVSSGTNYGGGAVYTDRKAIFTNSIFTGNRAEGRGFGGGIYAETDITVTSCTFGGAGSGTRASGNYAIRSGGAFFTRGEGTTVVQDCAFEENSAGEDGGAFYIEGATSHNTIIENSLFRRNTAQTQGGALSLLGSSASITSCIFDSNANVTGITGLSGGAAYLATQTILISNCEFYNNSVLGGNINALGAGAGKGGALYLDWSGSDAGTWAAILTCTFVNNKATTTTGFGGGVFLNRTSGATMMGNLMVGNTSGSGAGADVMLIAPATVTSAGYNILTAFGIFDTGTNTSTSSNWNSTPYVYILGEPGIDAVSNSYQPQDFISLSEGNIVRSNLRNDGATEVVTGANGAYDFAVIVLRESTATSANISLGFISNTVAREQYDRYGIDYEDILGNMRPGQNTWDVGSHQISAGVAVNPGGEVNLGFLNHIKISGIPNTMRTPGQTTNLIVKGYDNANRLVANNVPVVWTIWPGGYKMGTFVTNDYICIYDGTNRLDTLRVYENGYILITATINGTDIFDSVKLYVRDENTSYSHTNVFPEFAEYLDSFNLAHNDVNFAINSVADMALVNANNNFQKEFAASWPGYSTVTQVQSVTDSNSFKVNTETNSYLDSDGFTSIKEGVRVSLSGRSAGEMVPLEYSWSYTPSELSKLLGRTVTSTPSNSELARIFRVAFKTKSSEYLPVLGSNGVTFQNALDNNILEIESYGTKDGQGTRIKFTAYVANASASSSKPKLISSTGNTKLLVVPDGLVDREIYGTMFILQKAVNSISSEPHSNGGEPDGSGGDDSGGGGGCNAQNLGIAAAILMIFVFKRR